VILGREPALWGALVRSLVVVLSTFILPLTIDQQGWLNAVTAALIGLIVAATTFREKLVPAILGLLEAVLAGAIAWNWNLSVDKQAIIMTAAAAIVAVITRDRVVAPINEDGVRRA